MRISMISAAPVAALVRYRSTVSLVLSMLAGLSGAHTIRMAAICLGGTVTLTVTTQGPAVAGIGAAFRGLVAGLTGFGRDLAARRLRTP